MSDHKFAPMPVVLSHDPAPIEVDIYGPPMIMDAIQSLKDRAEKAEAEVERLLAQVDLIVDAQALIDHNPGDAYYVDVLSARVWELVISRRTTSVSPKEEP